jgi:hypothetical protein
VSVALVATLVQRDVKYGDWLNERSSMYYCNNI